jgi:hypothetical protein
MTYLKSRCAQNGRKLFFPASRLSFLIPVDVFALLRILAVIYFPQMAR